MAGAPVGHSSLRQLKQRVGLRCRLMPLSLSETGQYIVARVRVAGGNAASLFTREAVCLIHERSQGIPRTVSVICHNALIGGFAVNRRPVTAEVVQEVCEDFDLRAGLSDRANGQLHAAPLTAEDAEVAMAGPETGGPTAQSRTRSGLASAIMPLRRFFQM